MCDRCEELEERVIQLEGLLVGEGHFPTDTGLTLGEEKVLRHLVARGRVTMDSLEVVIWGRGDPPDSAYDVVRRHILHIRRKLVPVGLITVYGGGYLLEESQRARLRAMLVMEPVPA